MVIGSNAIRAKAKDVAEIPPIERILVFLLGVKGLGDEGLGTPESPATRHVYPQWYPGVHWEIVAAIPDSYGAIHNVRFVKVPPLAVHLHDADINVPSLTVTLFRDL